jgi:hypothetical protein
MLQKEPASAPPRISARELSLSSAAQCAYPLSASRYSCSQSTRIHTYTFRRTYCARANSYERSMRHDKLLRTCATRAAHSQSVHVVLGTLPYPLIAKRDQIARLRHRLHDDCARVALRMCRMRPRSTQCCHERVSRNEQSREHTSTGEHEHTYRVELQGARMLCTHTPLLGDRPRGQADARTGEQPLAAVQH